MYVSRQLFALHLYTIDGLSKSFIDSFIKLIATDWFYSLFAKVYPADAIEMTHSCRELDPDSESQKIEAIHYMYSHN